MTAHPAALPASGPPAERLAEDAAARERALALASFIVEAPAGAGKTELLTQRALRLLAVVDHPEEVLALTFTNKAAAEMRDRILGSLEIAERGVAPEAAHKRRTFALARAVLARDAERGWGLLAHPGRLRIATLDALCAGLARQMPYLSRFGGQPAIADDAGAHYATAARRTLEMVEGEGAEADTVAAALAFMDNNAGRLEALLVAMLARRDQWLPHVARIDGGTLRAEVEAAFAALIVRDLAGAARGLDARRQAGLMPLARFAAANAPGFVDALADWNQALAGTIDELPRWRALAGLLLTGGGTLRRTVDKRSGFPAGAAFAEQKAAMIAALEDLRAVPGLEAALALLPDLPPAELSDDEWVTVENFSSLLRLAAGQLWLAFQEAGEVDFIEVAARAGLALGEDEAPTDLAQALDYRMRHLLVDEFQDTSPSQVTLLAKLMRGWTPDDGRTLFVVGDPMQSIYRFRKADVGLFLRVRERGIGGLRLEHLRLYRNNRSCPAVVDWVNGAFPTIFPADDAPETGAVRYAASAATRADAADGGVTLHPVLFRDGEDPAADEARRVVALIREARRQAPDGEIAVLVRARSHLEAIAGELRRHAPDLRFQAVDIEGLDGRQHIQDLLILFAALYHRADRVNWLALLRAPWCGLTLADLHALAGDERRRTVWQLMHDEARLARLSADGRRRLGHVRAVLAAAFAGRDRQHPRRWLEGTWLLLGGPRCLAAPQAREDVAAFFALVDRLAAGGRLTGDILAGETAALFAPPDPLGGAVQMMTIHKSKGLEFDTVIVPGLHREAGGAGGSLLLWDEVAGEDGRERLLVAPMRRKGGAAQAGAYDRLRRLEAERSAHEDARLLYVAATRAVRRLHLLGAVRVDAEREEGLKPPPAGSLLGLLWPGIAAAAFAEALAALPEAAPAAADGLAAYEPPLVRLRQPGPAPWLPPAPIQPSSAANPPESALPATESPVDAAIGTLVHKCLERMARDGLAAWDEARLDSLREGWRRWLAGQGASDEDAGRGADEARQALATALSCEAGRWLLADHPGGAAEEAWSSAEADGVRHHVVDRTFIADGCRWIVDYKTVRVADGELAAAAERYRPQLERYAALFVAEGRPVRLAIYFTLPGRLVELGD